MCVGEVTILPTQKLVNYMKKMTKRAKTSFTLLFIAFLIPIPAVTITVVGVLAYYNWDTIKEFFNYIFED